jgi:hypothetical protein
MLLGRAIDAEGNVRNGYHARGRGMDDDDAVAQVIEETAKKSHAKLREEFDRQGLRAASLPGMGW